MDRNCGSIPARISLVRTEFADVKVPSLPVFSECVRNPSDPILPVSGGEEDVQKEARVVRFSSDCRYERWQGGS